METREFENVMVATSWLLSDDKIHYQTCTHVRTFGVLEERTLAPCLESIDNLVELDLLRKTTSC